MRTKHLLLLALLFNLLRATPASADDGTSALQMAELPSVSAVFSDDGVNAYPARDAAEESASVPAPAPTPSPRFARRTTRRRLGFGVLGSLAGNVLSLGVISIGGILAAFSCDREFDATPCDQLMWRIVGSGALVAPLAVGSITAWASRPARSKGKTWASIVGSVVGSGILASLLYAGPFQEKSAAAMGILPVVGFAASVMMPVLALEWSHRRQERLQARLSLARPALP